MVLLCLEVDMKTESVSWTAVVGSYWLSVDNFRGGAPDSRGRGGGLARGIG